MQETNIFLHHAINLQSAGNSQITSAAFLSEYDAITVNKACIIFDINLTALTTNCQVGTRGIICAEEARLKTMIALESRLNFPYTT